MRQPQKSSIKFREVQIRKCSIFFLVTMREKGNVDFLFVFLLKELS